MARMPATIKSRASRLFLWITSWKSSQARGTTKMGLPLNTTATTEARVLPTAS